MHSHLSSRSLQTSRVAVTLSSNPNPRKQYLNETDTNLQQTYLLALANYGGFLPPQEIRECEPVCEPVFPCPDDVEDPVVPELLVDVAILFPVHRSLGLVRLEAPDEMGSAI